MASQCLIWFRSRFLTLKPHEIGFFSCTVLYFSSDVNYRQIKDRHDRRGTDAKAHMSRMLMTEGGIKKAIAFALYRPIGKTRTILLFRVVTLRDICNHQPSSVRRLMNGCHFSVAVADNRLTRTVL